MPSAFEGLPRATLYSRADCSLCERAATLLARLATEGLLHWQRVDIASDPALLAAHAAQIPVVTIEGGATFHGRISEFRLRRALRR